MTWANLFKRFKAPALPQPGQEYSRDYLMRLTDVLRLYFNQLDYLLERIVNAQPINVQFYGTALDAFGRARFSQPYTLFDSQNRYAIDSQFDTALTGTGATNLLTNESSVELNVTNAGVGSVVRQTLRSFSYQPGKGLLVMATFVMDDSTNAELTQRVGYFNTENGVFVQKVGSTLSFVLRSNITGTPSDVRTVNQADWNGDRLDGTGASGFTLDISKAQILWMDFEWLGVGSVRCGFVIDGKTIICHTFQNANQIGSVYMTTAILPLRYEITSAAALDATLKQICSTVISEGGYEKRVATDVARMTALNTNISTSFVPLVSIRLASGRTGAVVLPDGYNVLPVATSGTTFEVVLVKNPTLTGTPSWVPTSSSNVEMDLSATGFTGGTIVYSTYVRESNQATAGIDNGGDYNWDLQLGATIAGTSDIYTIAARTLSGTQSAIGSLSFWDLT